MFTKLLTGFLVIFGLTFPATLHASTVQTSTKVSAVIELNRVTIFGNTSPNSRVELSSSRIFAVTYSDELGSFIFDKTILPKNPSELCFTSVGGSTIRTTPVCIPPPPPTNYHTNIGPIFLPPTISLESSNIKPNATAIISGYTIPLSQVDIFFFQTTSKPIIYPRSVNAFSLPKISTTANADGSYSLTLPTTYSSNYRVYTTSTYNDYSTPKSNTLLYKLPPIWYLLLIQYRFKILIGFIFLLLIYSCIILIHSKTNGTEHRTNISKG